MVTISVEQLKIYIDNLIKDVIPLAEANPLHDNNLLFPKLLEALLRRNLMRTQAVLALCVKGNKLSDSALEITRNIIEDVVSMEYILSKDSEKYTKRFYAFRWVQLKEDLDFYKSAGVVVDNDIFPDVSENIELEYDNAIQVYQDFINEKTKMPRRTWNARDFDQMLLAKEVKDALGERQIKTILRTYIDGSRKTHFNPMEVLVILNQEAWNDSTLRSERLALLVSASRLVRLTTRYIDQISHIKGENTFHEIGNKANEFLNTLQSVDRLTS